MASKPSIEEVKKFSLMIDELASELGCTRLDAILFHCDKTGLEVEVASTLISNVLKSRIREESERENLVKRSSRLPI